MKPQQIIRNHLSQINIMQLATSIDSQPWLCTVHFYTDDKLNFYWISRPDREHSKHIAQNSSVATYILIHENEFDGDYVMGIAMSGTAERVGKNIDIDIGQAYLQKLGKAANLLEEIAAGRNPHEFYRFKPSRLVLFDSKNFPDNPRQEVML